MQSNKGKTRKTSNEATRKKSSKTYGNIKSSSGGKGKRNTSGDSRRTQSDNGLKLSIILLVVIILAIVGVIIYINSGSDEKDTEKVATQAVTDKENITSDEKVSQAPKVTDSPSQAVTEAPSENDKEPADDAGRENVTEKVPSPTPVAVDTDKSKPEENTITTTTPEVTSEPTATPEQPATPAAEEDGRDECWEVTYISWLPKFNGGSFDRHEAADTFDMAFFTGVMKAEVNEYIGQLALAGFEVDIDTREDGDNIWYEAKNSNDWTAIVDYTEGTLRIGSGFYSEEESPEEDERDALWASTMLSYIPYYAGGIYEGYEEIDNAAEVFSYVTFTDAAEAEAIDYIEALKALGYIYDIEEGNADGVIWYTAMNEDRLSCYLAFESGIMRMGCGQYKDE